MHTVDQHLITMVLEYLDWSI